MKQLTIIIFLFFGTTCFSQDTEFGKYNNGLIYSDTTIKQLKFIVDSLNLKFKVCDLSKVHLSKFQAKAHFISLERGNIAEAKKDIEANILFDSFVKKYPKSELEQELLVVQSKHKNYQGKNVVQFTSLELNNKYDHSFNFEENLSKYNQPLKGKWVFKYYPKTKYSKESIEAFYFIEDFSQQAIPEVYSRMIQYADCMVDTTTQIFFDKAVRSGTRYPKTVSTTSVDFMNYVHKSTQRPEYNSVEHNEKNYEIYSKKYEIWDSLRISRMDSLKKNDQKFNQLLNEAVRDALNNGNTTGDEFEEYVGRYYSKKTELELKRNRRVIGGCSMDNSPRIHALKIAKLSAETINWEIFLRSHLDIMNDNFERVSDGSYAWQQRKTYIKELEVLDINVLDLLLGVCLRIENPSNNHYYGSIGRLGRALSETNKSTEIETKMLQMISDNRLDDYNRILIYYLYLNYNYNLEETQTQTVNNEKLMTAVKSLPTYLATKITVEK